MIKFWLVAGFIFISGFIDFSISAQRYYEDKDLTEHGIAVKAFPMEQEKRLSTIAREREAYISYKTPQGKEITDIIRLPNFLLTRLHENGFINIIYLPNKPSMIIYYGDKSKKESSRAHMKDGIFYSLIFITLLIFRQRVTKLLRFIKIPIPISY